MDTFGTYHADMTDPAWQPSLTARLRDHGLVTLAGISDRAALIGVARLLMTIRAHRDAAPDGVTEITDLGSAAPGYAAFTNSPLLPHTDGSSAADPPGLLLVTCAQPAAEGGATLVADGARIIAAMAARHPAALRALSAPRAARFGQHASTDTLLRLRAAAAVLIEHDQQISPRVMTDLLLIREETTAALQQTGQTAESADRAMR
jgi:alpha-ketoglutarate-dependent taurine dioxygenase